MAHQTPRGGQGSRHGVGVVSGFTLKLIRESSGLTQAVLAEQLQVDLATVQGWESGRRPLTALRSVDLIRLRAKLISCGAPPDAFSVLRDSLDADLLIGGVVEAGESLTAPSWHPLALAVHRRDLTNLITWPFFTEATPSRLASLPRSRTVRRGPVADRPVLSADDRTRFFDHLLVVADAFRTESDAVLRRQAIYLLGFDKRDTTREWLLDEQRDALRAVGRHDTIASWVTVRSSAIALAQVGESDPLQVFVTRGLADEQQEIANLNYWAYWVGEIEETYTDDRFMTERRGRRWSGLRLFEHLLSRMDGDSNHLILNVHTLWALLLARPRVLDDQPALCAAAAGQVERVLDTPDLPSRTRQELASVAYAIRLADR